MFEDAEDAADRRPFNPAERVKAKSDEFRMHAELAAVFEGIRKSDASLDTRFNADVARACQKTIGTLERQRVTDTPLLPPAAVDSAAALLDLPRTQSITTNDYHVARRPGEALIIRWLAAEQIDAFYQRLQAHFDAALEGFRKDEREAHAWRQDNSIESYLKGLDELQINMSDRYLRPFLKEHRLLALSTQAADEIDILHLCDLLLGVPAVDVVGDASAPRDESESERAWYFKLFSLRGWVGDIERICFFTYLQKTNDAFD